MLKALSAGEPFANPGCRSPCIPRPRASMPSEEDRQERCTRMEILREALYGGLEASWKVDVNGLVPHDQMGLTGSLILNMGAEQGGGGLEDYPNRYHGQPLLLLRTIR